MELVILVVHIILALALILVILLQPPENSSLGGLGGSNPMAGMGGRGQGNILTHTTAIIAGCFIVTSLILAIMAGHKPVNASILDEATESAPAMNTPKEAEKAPVAPVAAPEVPVSK